MRNQTDLLLINPGGRLNIYQTLASTLSAIEPPIWAGLIANYLLKRGHAIQILDANAEDLSPEEVAVRVAEASPLIAAVVVYGHNPSASTQVMPAAGAICRAIKEQEPGQATLLLGGHVAALPERTLREEGCDFVVNGEGPVTLHQLIAQMKGSRPDYTLVQGLLYWRNGSIAANPPAPLVGNLDEEMPGIAWDLLPMKEYRAHNWHCFDNLVRQPYAAFYTTLGCPFNCSFCCIQAPFKCGESISGFEPGKNSYRRWTPQSVIAEIDRLVTNYGIRNIKFADELFVLNGKHVNGICDLIIERGYDLNIWAYARVDTLQERILEKLRNAGVRWLGLGIESASDRIRRDTAKGFQSGKVLEAVSRVRRAGIYIAANYIFGLPEDDDETMQSTLDLAMELNTEWANFNCAMAYPGSRLYQEALGRGWRLPEKWSGYSQFSYDSLPLRSRHLSGNDILLFRDEAFHKYFSSPKYQKLIKGKFGDGAVSLVQEMIATPIKRRNLDI
jgi:radical SAM superfamily enzyme YgiQ (UPF0313 family)